MSDVQEMQARIRALQEKMKEFHPDRWDQIPDIELYKDQVISYMQRQHLGLGISEDEALTPAVINNYSKSGLLPRSKGKRYTREHIAYLTAICLLKQVVSVGDAGTLLAECMSREEVGDFYEAFSDLLDREYAEKAGRLEGVGTREQAAQLAMELAVSSYAEKLLCQQLIRFLADGEQE